MIEATASVFLGVLCALVADRVIVTGVQMWGMRRIGRKFMKNLEEMAKKPQPFMADIEEQAKREFAEQATKRTKARAN